MIIWLSFYNNRINNSNIYDYNILYKEELKLPKPKNYCDEKNAKELNSKFIEIGNSDLVGNIKDNNYWSKKFKY